MILQALNDYYHRKAAEDESALAPPGFERKEIPFVIVLDSEGNFVDLEDTRSGEGKKKRGRVYAVPQAVKRTVGVAANLLWDNPGYVFGVDTKGKPERAQKQHEAFVATIRERIPDAMNDAGTRAVLTFLEAADFGALEAHLHWPDVVEGGANVSFRLSGESELVCQRPVVLGAVKAGGAPDEQGGGTCLVSGEPDALARLHPAIKGVLGAQSSGANLVSFNLAAFNSHGREQGANAPVGERAAFAYTTALNHLLRRGSRQRLQLGDATTVFWAERTNALEDLLTDLLGEPPKDDPNRNTEALRALYSAPRTGTLSVDEHDPTPFYVLGLSPNAARISVRYWWVGTAGELAGSIRQHFEDLEIVRSPRDPEMLSVFRLLVGTAALGKAENIRPNLAGAFVQAVLENTPYPRELLAATLQRIRAEREITYARAALLKAWLLRESRRTPHPRIPEVSVSLDESNPDTAYRLGRLFAVLERLQEAANPGLNATIRDRFYGAASTTPVTVFPRLLKLGGHHLSKLDSTGLRVYYDRLIGQVLEGVHDYPQLLSLPEQGRFSIGYYHQRQAFFAKRPHEASEPEPVGAA